MRFEEAGGGWQWAAYTGRGGAAAGVSDRAFLRYIERYEESGLEGLIDKHRKRRSRAPWPGMMLHQDGSAFVLWIGGGLKCYWASSMSGWWAKTIAWPS